MNFYQLLRRINFFDTNWVYYFFYLTHTNFILGKNIKNFKIEIAFEFVTHIKILDAGGDLLHEIIIGCFPTVWVWQIIHIPKSLKIANARVSKVLFGYFSVLDSFQFHRPSLADGSEDDWEYVGVEY